MAEQDVIGVARANIEAFNKGDTERFKSLLAPDCIYEEAGTQRKFQGRDPTAQAFQAWKSAFPDSRGTITRALAQGNIAVLEVTWEGTQTGEMVGPLGTIPSSGKRVVVKAVQVVTVEGGKIKESHHYFDSVTLLQQVGAMPVPAGRR